MGNSLSRLQQFTKKLKVMLASGFPLLNALEFSTDAEDQRWARAVDSLCRDVSHGLPLSKAMTKWKNLFPNYYRGCIAAAEMSGRMVPTLSFLEGWLDREADLRARLKKAMFYPTIVLAVSLVMVLLLFNTVIPKLMNSFSSDLMEQSLPTKFLMAMTAVLSSPLFYVGGAVVIGLAVKGWRTEPIREKILIVFYSSPILGALLNKIGALRYVNALVLLLESGSSILPAIRSAGGGPGSPLLVIDQERVCRGISEGDSLSELWTARPDLYPSILVQMAMVGETASSLPDALGRCIPYLEMETHYKLERFSEIVEPVLISGVALFIGFVEISLVHQ